MISLLLASSSRQKDKLWKTCSSYIPSCLGKHVPLSLPQQWRAFSFQGSVTAAFLFIYFSNFMNLNFCTSETCQGIKFLILLRKINNGKLIYILNSGILNQCIQMDWTLLGLWQSHRVILKAMKSYTQREPHCAILNFTEASLRQNLKKYQSI